MTPEYALGLVFIFLVSIIWSFASVLVQYLYQTLEFDSPFLLTYIGTSLFTLFIPLRLLSERRDRIRLYLLKNVFTCRGTAWARGNLQDTTEAAAGVGGCIDETTDGITIIPWTAHTFHENGQKEEQCQSFLQIATESPVGTADRTDSLTDKQELHSSILLKYKTESLSFGSQSNDEKQLIATSLDPGNKLLQTNFGDALASSRLGTPSNVRNCCFDLTSPCPAGRSGQNVNASMSKPAPILVSPSVTHAGAVLSHVDHIKIAMRIAPVWFVSNYFYNRSLAFTSITSSTVLSSTGSLFTFLFSIFCGDEVSTGSKLLGVLLCVSGSILTGLNDVVGSSDGGEYAGNSSSVSHDTVHGVSTPAYANTSSYSPNHQTWGDVAGLASAVGYATYTVLIRTLCPKDERRMSMQLMLGYLGLINMLILSPIAARMILDAIRCADPITTGVDAAVGADDNGFTQTKTEVSSSSFFGASSHEHLTWTIFFCLIVKGLLDDVLSDYLWARSVILTSATVATVGLALTIPLAFVSDLLMGRASEVTSPRSIVGALFVLSGFLFVNIGETKQHGDLDDTGGRSSEENEGLGSHQQVESLPD